MGSPYVWIVKVDGEGQSERDGESDEEIDRDWMGSTAICFAPSHREFASSRTGTAVLI